MSRFPIHHVASLSALAIVMGLSAGCRHPIELRPELPPPTQGGVLLTPLSPTADRDKARQVLAVRLRMITLQLPLGACSDSEEIWSYLNEEPAGARTITRLAYNGMRAGLGVEGVWPDVARILRRLSGQRLRRSHVVAPPGSPLPIVLRRFSKRQTIFTFRADRTLVGRDYPPGDNLLVTATGFDWDNPSAVRLSCTPLVRTTRRRARYVHASGSYVLVNEPDYLPIHDLSFAFTVPAGGFVLIGPGREARRESSPGNHFLVRLKKGVPFETILVIAPEVFAAPVRPIP